MREPILQSNIFHPKFKLDAYNLFTTSQLYKPPMT